MADNIDQIQEVQIHYQKNPMYREIYTDGAVGDITPTGSINICFYATRKIMPKSVIHKVENGVLTNEHKVSDDSKEGILREIEFGIYLSKKSAKDLHEFLGRILNK